MAAPSGENDGAEDLIDAPETNAPDKAARPPRRKQRWRDRPSIHALRESVRQEDAYPADFDQESNEASRLPPDEAVHLGGFVLVEAFTPSTGSNLYSALEGLPIDQPDRKREWVTLLRDSRSAHRGGGWSRLALVRPPGRFIASDGFHDSTLPTGVDAVWLSLHLLLPSLAVVVATFTFEEDAADLSGILRRDFSSQPGKTHIHVPGRLGSLRARIPWARPRNFRVWTNYWDVDELKRQACEEISLRYERDCWDWLNSRFRGRFAAERYANRPRVRLMFTTNRVPLAGRERAFGPVALDSSLIIWRSKDMPGWAMSLGDGRVHRFGVIAAARRSDAVRRRDAGENAETLWRLTQDFHSYQSSLVVRWALLCLISICADRLGELRDRAGTRRRIGRPVRQARDLDGYLLGDGLDASTVVSDVLALTENERSFDRHVVDYSEDRDEYPDYIREAREPLKLLTFLRDSIRERAQRLHHDTDATTANVNSSAQLRQAIANTRLQRFVLLLATIATIAAIVSLVISSTSD